MKVLAPCLNISLLAPQHPAIALHEGWCAARNREPFDATQPPAWQAGFQLWKQAETNRMVRDLRQVLAVADCRRPRVYPPL